MEKLKKIIWGLAFMLLAFSLCLAGDSNVQASAQEPAGYVTATVEKLTIGQGFLVEPCKVPFYSGENYAQIFDRIMQEHNFAYDADGDLNNSFYLKKIIGADNGNLQIPAVIQNMGTASDAGGSTVAPPDNTTARNLEYPHLGEFAYCKMSGWMYSVNGYFPDVAMSGRRASDGELVRYQFTLFGYGADLGSEYRDGSIKGIEPLLLADKSELIKKVAELNQEKEKWESRQDYQNAVNILETLDAGQGEVDTALARLNGEGTVEPETVSVEPEVRLEVQETAVLTPAFTPESTNLRNVTFTSSDDTIVSVSRTGKLTPKKAGEADITVTTENGKTAVCHVTVYKNPVPLTGITVKDMRIGLGTGRTLEVGKVPENADDMDTISYESSDPSVVSVDPSGALSGRQAGKAVITVKAVQGDKEYQAECTVEVVTGAEPLSAPLKEVLEQTRDYILSKDTAPDMGSQWHAIGLARGGFLTEDYKDAFYQSVVSRLKETGGELSKVKYTEYSKLVLAVTAIGKDARNIAGYNLLEKLADFDMVAYQGFNGPIWALTALNARPEYEIPQVSGVKTQTTEQGLIDYILNGEVEGGGWTLFGKVADVDITAMAIQALAPYYQKEGREAVTEAIDRALAWLSIVQMDDGGFYTLGDGGKAANSESTSQVITALSALGINCQTDSFVKGDKWMVNALLSYRKDGGFMQVKPGGDNNGGAQPGEVDGMATEQAFYALAAYQRMLDGKTALYDMSDVTLTSGEDQTKPQVSGSLKLKVSKASTSSITLKWSRLEGVQGYKVFYYQPSAKKYAEALTLGAGKTTCTLKRVKGAKGAALKSGTTYKLRVSGYTLDNKKAVYHKTENITASTNPGKVSASVRRVSAKKAKITWKKVSGCSGYEIYMSGKKNSGWKKVKTVKGAGKTSYTRTNLDKKKNYYFKVRAYKEAGGQKAAGAFSAVKQAKAK